MLVSQANSVRGQSLYLHHGRCKLVVPITMLKIKAKNHLYPFPYSIKLLANKLIYSKVKPAIGMDRARVCVSGAAPISQKSWRLCRDWIW